MSIRVYWIIIKIILWIGIFLAITSPTLAQQQSESRIAFAAFQNGQWDIFMISADASDLRQLTNDSYEDTDPAFSPDGTKLAYASRRNNNWDIYILDLANKTETRLTTHPHYDGAPAWHPTGEMLAFESYRSEDLDIWLIEIKPNSTPRNLTADSAAGEFNPAWHSNGKTLFFSSWRTGSSDIWQLDIASGDIQAITTDPASTDSQAVWDANTKKLAFSRNVLGDSDIFWHNLEQSSRYSWLGSLTQPAFSPDGNSMAGIYHSHGGAYLIRLDTENPIPIYLTKRISLQGAISWHSKPVITGTPLLALTLPDPSPLYQEDLTPSSSPHGEPYDFVRLNSVSTGSPWLADTVDDSYRALRTHLWEEVGFDFLGEVSEMIRPINFFTEASQYSSWHKSGRAFDTRLDLPGGGFEIVREDIGGETYWRILLRCVDQSGRCGRPITAKPWNYSTRARTVLAPEQGGLEKGHLYGYYVDFALLAEVYGWERISSYDDEDFSWKWHLKAFEYWHYLKRFSDNEQAHNWYQAMLQVYPKAEVDSFFTWDKMRAADEEPYLIITKGVSVPPRVVQWWQELTRMDAVDSQ